MDKQTAYRLGRAFSFGRCIGGGMALDDAKWITIHPNGKGKNADYQRIKIDEESGKIIGGMNFRFQGKTLKEAFGKGKEKPEKKSRKPSNNVTKLPTADQIRDSVKSISFYFAKDELDKVRDLVEKKGYPEGVEITQDAAVKVTINPKYKNVLAAFSHKDKVIVSTGKKREEAHKFAMEHDETCDECGHKHANRALSYVVETPEGMKLIGSACYDRVQNLALVRALRPKAQFVKEDDDEEKERGNKERPKDIKKETSSFDRFIVTGMDWLLDYGYVSPKNAWLADESPTSEKVFRIAAKDKDKEWRVDNHMTRKFREFVKNSEPNSFNIPVQVAMESNVVNWNNKGRIMWALNDYFNKLLQKQKEGK